MFSYIWFGTTRGESGGALTGTLNEAHGTGSGSARVGFVIWAQNSGNGITARPRSQHRLACFFLFFGKSFLFTLARTGKFGCQSCMWRVVSFREGVRRNQRVYQCQKLPYLDQCLDAKGR